MAEPAHLLPSSASAQEIAISQAAGARVEGIPVPIGQLWSPATCPEDLLPWLAWAASVDTWDDTWPESAKRSVIADSYAVHCRKGTVGAVKRGLQSIGFGGADITEGFPPWVADGSAPANNTVMANGLRRWAEFSITLDLGESRGFPAGAGAAVREQIARWKPARSHLTGLSVLLRLSTARDATPSANARLRIQVALSAERDGPLPVQAGALRRYIADGTVPGDGSAIVGGYWPYLGAIAGPPRDSASIQVRIQARTERTAPKLRADGAARASGEHAAGYIGPIDIDYQWQRGQLDLALSQRPTTAYADGTVLADGTVIADRGIGQWPAGSSASLALLHWWKADGSVRAGGSDMLADGSLLADGSHQIPGAHAGPYSVHV